MRSKFSLMICKSDAKG